MKKILGITLVVMVSLFFAACNEETDPPPELILGGGGLDGAGNKIPWTLDGNIIRNKSSNVSVTVVGGNPTATPPTQTTRVELKVSITDDGTIYVEKGEVTGTTLTTNNNSALDTAIARVNSDNTWDIPIFGGSATAPPDIVNPLAFNSRHLGVKYGVLRALNNIIFGELEKDNSDRWIFDGTPLNGTATRLYKGHMNRNNYPYSATHTVKVTMEAGKITELIIAGADFGCPQGANGFAGTATATSVTNNVGNATTHAVNEMAKSNNWDVDVFSGATDSILLAKETLYEAMRDIGRAR